MKNLLILLLILSLSIFLLSIGYRINSDIEENKISSNIHSVETLIEDTINLEDNINENEEIINSSSSTYSFDCPNDKLTPITLSDTNFCHLDVKYFNQVLNSSGEKVEDPSKKGRVSYMCTAASSVMIMGYYNELKFNTNDELREHMYKALSSTELEEGNTIKVNGKNIKLCMGGAFSLTSYDPSTGKSMCNWNNNVNVYFNYFGYKIKKLNSKFEEIVKEIDQGRPILFGIAPYDQLAGGIYQSHYVVVKGYSIGEGKKVLLLNDPDRDLNKVTPSGQCAGLSYPPSLDGENSFFDFNNHKCSRVNAFYSVYK